MMGANATRAWRQRPLSWRCDSCLCIRISNLADYARASKARAAQTQTLTRIVNLSGAGCRAVHCHRTLCYRSTLSLMLLALVSELNLVGI